MIRVRLPWHCMCSVNQRTNPIRGRQFLTRKYRTALGNAQAEVVRQIIEAGRKWSPVESQYGTAEVGVEFRYWRPDNRRRDVSNLDKLVEDAISGPGRIIDDDSQIKERQVHDMGIDCKDPRCVVKVWRL